jgi:WD40 repeat protein
LNLSDDGFYAAYVNGKDLVVYTNPASEDKEAQIARIKENGVKYLKFCPIPASSSGPNDNSQRRLLSANDSRITVWQLEPLHIFAEIENLEPGALSVDFGSDGNEILVFHAWNTKLTIHSLDTSRSSVIRTPKATHPLGFGYRPHTRQFAILLKPDASDLLTIHESQSYELVGRAVLPTIDAQGLKWSPDGKWIAVWDVASGGTKVLIFTADGQLFRTYTGPACSDDAFDLGVKQIEWSPAAGPSGPSEVLAVGKVNGTIDLLRTRTVRCTRSLPKPLPR